jgi:hypothetical protein
MAEKRYKITAAVIASPQYVQASEYGFKTSFGNYTGLPAGQVRVCQVGDCPLITCLSTDVLGTTNEWAQKFMEAAVIPASFNVNGSSWLGTPGAAVFEITADPVTIDLDAIFP